MNCNNLIQIFIFYIIFASAAHTVFVKILTYAEMMAVWKQIYFTENASTIHIIHENRILRNTVLTDRPFSRISLQLSKNHEEFSIPSHPDPKF